MTKFAQLLSRAIRILRGNRDESARASHLVVNKEQFAYNELLPVNQAEREKFFQSTFFERKIMSTKTAFKRVALVAAAALAIGGISAVSANAVNPTIDSFAGAAVGVSSTASLTTGVYTAETLTSGSLDKYYTITTSGVGSVNYPAAPAGETLSAQSSTTEIYSQGLGAIGTGAFTGVVGENLVVSVYSAVAGTQTVTVTGSTNAAITFTITWGAAPVLSVANSIVASNNATDVTTPTKLTVATEDTGLTSVDTNGTLGGGAYVLVNNNATVPAAISTDTISASVTGPGIVHVGSTYANSAAAAGGRSVSNAQGVGSTAVVLVYGDGTAGTSTVTVSDSTAGVVLGTFSVIFYSTTIAKLVAKTNFSVPLANNAGFTSTPSEGFTGANGTAGAGAPVSVIATDANGNAIPSSAGITVSSGTTTVATVGALAYDATNGYVYVAITPVSEGSSVITFSDTATGLVTATTTVWVVSTVAASVVAATDAQSYDPGTKVLYTLTATDAKGNPVADGTYASFFSAAPTSNVGLQGTLPGTASVTFAGGVNTSTVYSPVTSANVAIAGGTLASTANGNLNVATALQGTATNEADFAVTGSSDVAANAATDAANEATDAANAATDAANAAADSADAATQAAQDAGDKADAALAAVTALSQQVTTVLAKVAAISVLLVRIIKKVKA